MRKSTANKGLILVIIISARFSLKNPKRLETNQVLSTKQPTTNTKLICLTICNCCIELN